MSKRPASRSSSETDWKDEDGRFLSESDSWENASGKSKGVKNANFKKSAAKKRKTEDKMGEPSQSCGRILGIRDSKHPRSQHSIQFVGPVRTALLRWFFSVRDSRGMPWRKPFSLSESLEDRAQRAYEVWVSEVMLQQTQVATVIPYYNRWMETFPTLNDLAKASMDQVNALWKGLGYYRRARRLLEGATIVSKEYGGKLPDNAQQMQAKIPGIGRYSAGAICSIAYGERVPVLDGNVHRLLSRFLALHAPPKAKATLDILWDAAGAMVQADEDQDVSHPGDINQALIELGSTVCKVREPSCVACPLQQWCSAYAQANNQDIGTGLLDIEDLCNICEPVNQGCAVTNFPMKVDRKKPREELDIVNVIEWRRSSSQRFFLLVKRPESGLLAGLYDFAASVNISKKISRQVVKDTSLRLLGRLFGRTFQEITGLASASDKAGADSTILEHMVKIAVVGDVLHTFSHIKKTYRVVWIVMTGGDRPPEFDQASESDELQENSPKPRKNSKISHKNLHGALIPTENVWVPLNEVADTNMGTGSIKVWNIAKNFWEMNADDSWRSG